MKKLLLASLCILLLSITQIFAQNRTVTGTVTAKDDGLPLPGVSVKVKGSTVGTQTGSNGKFTLSVPKGSTLIFSFIGYAPLERPVGLGAVNVALETSSKSLGEVVVTGALGIKRQAKEQGAAATTISNKTLTEAHATNFTNGLTAKVAGLVVSTLDNGINPQTRFTLRGNRHILGNNYALVVLNGTPISPNEVNTINPDDIESVNVLNGAGAAALYGSDASNGALIITTRRGSSTGAPQVSYTNTFLLEKVAYFPDLQTKFGSYGGEGPPFQDPVTGFITTPAPFENQSYGPAYDGHLQQLGIPLQDGTVQKYPYSTPSTDPRKAFFVTGHSEENNLSYAQGDASNSFNLTANNLFKTGVLPDDKFKRSSVRISASKTYSKFKADFTASYVQSYTNTVGNGGYDGSTLDGGRSLYSAIFNTPSWVPLTKFKDINAPFADVNTYFNSYGVNPYWIIKNDRVDTRSDHFNGSFGGMFSPTNWFDASYRLSGNFGTAQQQYRRSQVNFSPYALGKLGDPTGGNYGTQAQSYGGSTGVIPGQVQNVTQFGDGSITSIGAPLAGPFAGGGTAGPQGYSRLQQDFFLNFHKTFFSDFKTSLLLGSSIWQMYLNQISNSSTNLLVNNFYSIGSILGTPTTAQLTYKIRQIGYFGDFNIGYKDYAFLEATIRNDHDSRLGNGIRSFWYPSVKGSFIFTDAIPALKGNSIINYGKLRASFSQVGDINVAPYSTVNTFSPTTGFPYGNTGGLTLGTTLNNPLIKPEKTKEIEFGTDLSFFNSRINVSATYYKSNTTNQTLSIVTAPETGYSNASVNIGEVQNTGTEFKLDVAVLTKESNGFGLNLGGNLAIQNSKVISLINGSPSVTVGSQGSAFIQARVGQPFPALYGTDVQRDPQGHVIVDPVTGYPESKSDLVYLGRTAPKYILGLTQTFSYKFITLTTVSEFRSGYVIYNQGLASATAAGVSQFSASADRQAFIFPNSVLQTGPNSYVPNTSTTVVDGNQGFWNAGAFYNSVAAYTTSGAFWKLREANLSFDISQFTRKTKFIKRASFAIIGRNLVMLRPKSNKFTDPEYSATAGNATGIINTYQLPPTRFFGASLNVTF
ncbi:TonB-linked outer membrane protein, SusC/RagA family [Mucilaginibacter lappiensis]|uniref:TonB-linked SusC/RagA family outer membrane protein n=1 Tax=Mucilaginibacter lappiensis TaxID=354630 RepID=A0ABR6PPW3_9SPHI|nr:SusC/RagA family TonB-linked outer membrane protein [Mucilaginibacter lappiensis]MBB6111814.1 TonB-linked SusC/RagA family outer membrane protein [Mucilaginibacter lappiensis]SIR88050.1 TonB-linked outer membrane protein, SusC/RagA family [Mucilaginibacter lappiensis]